MRRFGHDLPSCWPNLFIAGVPKAGTRSLTNALAAHPDVYVPVHDQPRFFVDLGVERHWARFFNITQEEGEYLALFRNGAGLKYRCDSSPEYVLSAEAMRRIRAVEPAAKVIVVLRDPVDRAYSHYLNDVREGIESRTFLKAIREQLSGADPQRWPTRYVLYGHYEQALRDASAVFGENLTVIFFEELTGDPDTVLRHLAEFLFLDFEGLSMAGGLLHLNRAALPRSRTAARMLGSPSFRRVARAITVPRTRSFLRHAFISGNLPPPIDPEARRLLQREYADEANAVARVLGRRPPWRSGTGGRSE